MLHKPSSHNSDTLAFSLVRRTNIGFPPELEEQGPCNR